MDRNGFAGASHRRYARDWSKTSRRAFALAPVFALVGSLLVVTGTATAAACQVVDTIAPSVSHTTLQSAVDAASSGDTLRVQGTCVGNTIVDMSLTIAAWPRATLDGNHTGSVLTIEPLDRMPTVTLKGLTITHGTALDGGGINYFGGTLTLIDLTITDNAASRGGGGIESGHALVILDDTTVKDNTAGVAGGISSTSGSLYLFGSSSVHHNTASGDGGGIVSGDGNAYLYDTASVHHNAAGGSGGGIRTFAFWLYLNDGSSVDHNTAGGDGGGIAASDGARLIVAGSSSIRRNTAGGDGGGAYIDKTAVALALSDTSLISGNKAGGEGGGVWSSILLETYANVVPGVNVIRNHPDDVFIAP